MKAFLAGLLFLLAASVLIAVGMLLYPLFLIVGCLMLVFLAIWLLGKAVLYIRKK